MPSARLTLLLACLLAAGPASAQLRSSKRRELGRIQAELERTRRELSEFRRQEKALAEDMKRLKGRSEETRRKVAKIQAGISQAERKKGELKHRIGALRLASDFWSSALSSELKDYAGDSASRDGSEPTSALWAEAFRRSAIGEKTEILASLRGASRKTEAAEADALRRARELLSSSRRAKEEQAKSRLQYEEKKAAAAVTRERLEAAERRERELQESAVALTKLLDRLGRAGSYRRTAPVAGLDAPKNSLPWPVEGTVARGFGREKNPELGTWVIRQGVSFLTKPGSPVAAVDRGTVIYSGAFRSYGRVVILDHGASFFSIYGELGEILKTKGARVKAGEAIGRSGERKAGEGALYLELRRGTEALDPMVWLHRR